VSDVTRDTVANLEERLDGVERALRRLRDGTYRQCQVCSAAIDDSLLEVDPARATCAAHPTLDEGSTSS
jgi:RNA polymerase-binding transcription factor DksA